MSLHPGLLIVQILIMLTPPIATYLIAIMIDQNVQTACYVAAIAAFLVVGGLQTVSFIVQANDNKA